jgi:hypothetical protein
MKQLLAFLLLIPNASYSRTIYLNGVDISSARNSFIENANLRIDSQGNILIEAPHYQVNEENTYTPLSSWNQVTSTPLHQPASPIKSKKSPEIEPQTKPETSSPKK